MKKIKDAAAVPPLSPGVKGQAWESSGVAGKSDSHLHTVHTYLRHRLAAATTQGSAVRKRRAFVLWRQMRGGGDEEERPRSARKRGGRTHRRTSCPVPSWSTAPNCPLLRWPSQCVAVRLPPQTPHHRTVNSVTPRVYYVEKFSPLRSRTQNALAYRCTLSSVTNARRCSPRKEPATASPLGSVSRATRTRGCPR